MEDNPYQSPDMPPLEKAPKPSRTRFYVTLAIGYALTIGATIYLVLHPEALKAPPPAQPIPAQAK